MWLQMRLRRWRRRRRPVAFFDENKRLIPENADIGSFGEAAANLRGLAAEKLIRDRFRDHHHQFLLRKGDRLYPLQNDGLEADDKIHPAMGKLCFQLGGVSLKKSKLHQGELFAEGGEDLWQQGKAAGVGDAYPESAQIVAVDVAHLGEELAVQIQDLSGGLHQLVACVGQRELGGAGKELDVQLPLHVGNVVGKGLLGDIQPLSSAGDVELLRHHEEIFQVKKIHGATSFWQGFVPI